MHEYKAVPAPARAQKVRGLKTTEDRFAHALTEVLNAQAAQGWEFVRTESLPCEERKGLTGTRVTTQILMIFRRERAPAFRTPASAAAAPPSPGEAGEQPSRPPFVLTNSGADPTDSSGDGHNRPRSEPVFRPGALFRPGGGRSAPPLRGDSADVTGPSEGSAEGDGRG